MNIIAILSALCCSLLIGQNNLVISAEEEPDLIQVLRDVGVADPENINDYISLLPQHNFSVTDVRGETEITVIDGEGRSYVIHAICLTRSNDTIAFEADVEGWGVTGLLSLHTRNQVKLQYQFQVPLDIYSSPPVTMIIRLVPSYNWLPTPIVEGRIGGTDPYLVGIGGVYATDCKCIGKGSGDGACVARDCAEGNSCGGVKECLETEVGGPGFLPTLLMLLGLFAYFGSRRCPQG